MRTLVSSDAFFLDRHALDDPTGLDVPLSQATIRATRDDPTILPFRFFLLVVFVVVTLASSGSLLGFDGSEGKLGGSPSDRQQPGFGPLKLAVMNEVGIVREGDESERTVFAAEREERRCWVRRNRPERAGLGGEETLL